ncbi:hypothetical protein C7R92_26845 [Brevibacillus porteri]|uniref:Uncharacterized protein n=1 Tax=Brevibacillus porteri TaxID=2126350 RepID=A0ABX5FHN2_9BACL|nr:hypothetical protein C7R92_26845 [Brevibacillus porteri]
MLRRSDELVKVFRPVSRSSKIVNQLQLLPIHGPLVLIKKSLYLLPEQPWGDKFEPNLILNRAPDECDHKSREISSDGNDRNTQHLIVLFLSLDTGDITFHNLHEADLHVYIRSYILESLEEIQPIDHSLS